MKIGVIFLLVRPVPSFLPGTEGRRDPGVAQPDETQHGQLRHPSFPGDDSP